MLRQPRHLREDGTRKGGGRRGGSATRAGEPEAGQLDVAPMPGGNAESSTATATGESPQSPRDRHWSAADLAFALARFRPDFAASSPGCSIVQLAPRMQLPLRNSGQTPEAGAPGLEAREEALASHAFMVTSSSAVRGR